MASGVNTAAALHSIGTSARCGAALRQKSGDAEQRGPARRDEVRAVNVRLRLRDRRRGRRRTARSAPAKSICTAQCAITDRRQERRDRTAPAAASVRQAIATVAAVRTTNAVNADRIVRLASTRSAAASR